MDYDLDVHHLDVTSSYTLTSGGSTRYASGMDQARTER